MRRFHPKNFIFLLFVAVVLLPSCVKKKLFLGEKTARNACEARELVYIRETNDRKREAANLVKEVGELNRTIGGMEKQLSDLLAESELKSAQFGSTYEQLKSELVTTQTRLKDTQTQLSEKIRQLEALNALESSRLSRLSNIETGLRDVLMPWVNQDLNFEMFSDRMELTVPDRLLFDASGLRVQSSGRTLLLALARFLAERPEQLAEVHAHTDINLPKGIEDSYTWAFVRASSITKVLVREGNVNANQLSPVAKGDFFPVASNQTDGGRAQNRRTVFIFR